MTVEGVGSEPEADETLDRRTLATQTTVTVVPMVRGSDFRRVGPALAGRRGPMVRSGLQWSDPGRPEAVTRDGVVPLAPEPVPATTSEETIFSLIADRARGHSVSHLAITATIGLIDAIALGLAHRSAWPVAALFAAAGAYGLWGLIDRALTARVEQRLLDGPATTGIRVVREMVALLGFAALIAAAGGIFGASLGGWRH